MKKTAVLISGIVVSMMFGVVFQNCVPIKPISKNIPQASEKKISATTSPKISSKKKAKI